MCSSDLETMLEHGLELTPATAGTDMSRPGAYVIVAPLHRGWHLPRARLAVVAEADLTGRRRAHRRPRPRGATTTFEGLRPGSYVVHEHHGVGRYAGMVTRAIGGAERDYLLLAYKGADKLYVPSDQIGSLRPYIGGETPSLHRLGGSDFAASKTRVRSAVREIAQELVLLYQRRVSTEGYAFGADTPWQAEMESAFPFVETPDQRRAIDEVKADMDARAAAVGRSLRYGWQSHVIVRETEDEARAAARIHHPNVCHLYEIAEEDGELFLAMELLEGESLADQIGRAHV